MGCFGVLAELLSLLLCIGAVVTNVLLLLSCDLWRVESLLFDEGSLGLFSWKVPASSQNHSDQECTPIVASEEQDFYEGQILVCARWSAVAALALGGIMIFLIFFQQYLIPFPCTPLLRDICAIGAQICLGLVYVTYFSKLCTDFECHYAEGTLLLIVTQSLWAVGGVLSLCMRPGRYARAQAEKAESNKPTTGSANAGNANGNGNANGDANHEDAAALEGEARDTFESGGANQLEAGLAKYEKDDDEDGGMSETSSMAVGMSMNPDDDKPDGRLEQSTGLAKQEKESALSS
ncbi:unnamed protein product [Cylindrotheca closterium]|uniref:Transmembrane protein n=1 Tax=Cylindrotheca closterium TaxID=2856 RepID=A0AAD2GAT4_9STRA|nr:unnamed protein product [Cylindrotheca closterium]